MASTLPAPSQALLDIKPIPRITHGGQQASRMLLHQSLRMALRSHKFQRQFATTVRQCTLQLLILRWAGSPHIVSATLLPLLAHRTVVIKMQTLVRPATTHLQKHMLTDAICYSNLRARLSHPLAGTLLGNWVLGRLGCKRLS